MAVRRTPRCAASRGSSERTTTASAVNTHGQNDRGPRILRARANWLRPPIGVNPCSEVPNFARLCKAIVSALVASGPRQSCRRRHPFCLPLRLPPCRETGRPFCFCRGCDGVRRKITGHFQAPQWIGHNATTGHKSLGSLDEARVFQTRIEAEREADVFRVLLPDGIQFEIEHE